VLPVITDDCTKCGKCVSGCPERALSFTEGELRIVTVDASKCTRCGACVEMCPPGAIAMARAIWEQRLVAGAAPVPERRAPIIRRAPSYTPPDIGGLPAVRI
jgi:ferredoxin